MARRLLLHWLALAAASGVSLSPGEAAGRVSIRLGTFLNEILASLNEKGLLERVDVPEVDTTFQLLKTADLEKVRTAYQVLDKVGFWLPVAWMLLVTALLTFARDRRRAAAWLAYGGGGSSWSSGWSCSWSGTASRRRPAAVPLVLLSRAGFTRVNALVSQGKW